MCIYSFAFFQIHLLVYFNFSERTTEKDNYQWKKTSTEKDNGIIHYTTWHEIPINSLKKKMKYQ